MMVAGEQTDFEEGDKILGVGHHAQLAQRPGVPRSHLHSDGKNFIEGARCQSQSLLPEQRRLQGHTTVLGAATVPAMEAIAAAAVASSSRRCLQILPRNGCAVVVHDDDTGTALRGSSSFFSVVSVCCMQSASAWRTLKSLNLY